MRSSSLHVWLLAARPKTLTAAVVPAIVGAAIAWRMRGTISFGIFAFILLASLAIQIATNLFNDAIDAQKGTDTAERLGPMRATQSGLLRPSQVKRAAVGCIVAAILAGIPLAIVGGWPIVAIGVASLLLAYAYTGGPLPLAYKGLGEIFVILFFGIVAVMGTVYLLARAWPLEGMIAGLQIGMLATVLLVINNLRDVEGDRRAGKRTLAVRFGARFARREILFFSLSPFLLSLWWWRAAPFAAMLPWASLPLAIMIPLNVFCAAPSARYNTFLGWGALVHLQFGLLLAAGVLWR